MKALVSFLAVIGLIVVSLLAGIVVSLLAGGYIIIAIAEHECRGLGL